MRFLLTILLGLSITSVNAASPSATMRCTYLGGFAVRVCPVSMTGLIANASNYQGSTVAVSGHVKEVEGNLYLFIGKEFADNASMADSIKLTGRAALLKGKHGSWVTVIGALESLGENYHTDNLFRPAASLTVQDVM